jgi:hypothetical protein
MTEQSSTAGTMEDTLREHGIAHVPVDYFHIDGFRYTNLDDAVSQAKRTKARAAS